jgi:hypothetical protein
MRPRILHDLSRHLAIRLEEGIRGGAEEKPIPVFLCHPLDLAEAAAAGPLEGVVEPQESGEVVVRTAGTRVAGALYLYRIAPDARYRQAGSFAEPALDAAIAVQRRRYGFWVRLRYAFLVLGGSHEDELGALGGALQTLYATPYLSLAELGTDDGSVSAEVDCFPVEVVEDPGVWRELGLEEHRLGVVFEVSLPLASREVEQLAAVVDRDLVVELPPPRSGIEGVER